MNTQYVVVIKNKRKMRQYFRGWNLTKRELKTAVAIDPTTMRLSGEFSNPPSLDLFKAKALKETLLKQEHGFVDIMSVDEYKESLWDLRSTFEIHF